jgi:replicative DNA helicase|tara:strand:+ start:729 stop:1946 length:1218 start_codon:yes stop_codon:yes gene_type:complete
MLDLIKSLCSKDAFHSAGPIPVSAFDKEPKRVVQTLVEVHDKFDRDITVGELRHVFFAHNTTLTEAQKDTYKVLFAKIDHADTIGADVVTDVMQSLWRVETGRRISELGFELMEGVDTNLNKIKKLIEDTSEGFVSTGSPFHGIDLSPDSLLDSLETQSKWAFNLSALAERVPGVSPGHFVVVGSRPETGKTSSHASFAMSAGGWIDQGAVVHVLCNEEPAERVALRYMSASTNKTEPELLASKGQINGEFKRGNLLIDRIDDTHGIDGVESHLNTHGPDILVIDMLDKVTIEGSSDLAQHERLRELYRRTRDLATKYGCVIFGYSQLSAEAEGRVNLNLSMMENSRTGKAAEADLMLLIGKYSQVEGAQENDPRRVFNIAKNKISGWHGQIHVMLDGRKAKYDD